MEWSFADSPSLWSSHACRTGLSETFPNPVKSAVIVISKNVSEKKNKTKLNKTAKHQIPAKRKQEFIYCHKVSKTHVNPKKWGKKVRSTLRRTDTDSVARIFRRPAFFCPVSTSGIPRNVIRYASSAWTMKEVGQKGSCRGRAGGLWVFSIPS